MSKKKFTDGLESIFGVSEGGNLQESSPLLVKTDKASKKKAKKAKKKAKSNTKAKARKHTGKNFTSDLDSLFETALHHQIIEKADKLVDDEPVPDKAARQKPKARMVTGLDALIRRTTTAEPVPQLNEEQKGPTKRVTFAFDKSKLQKLKKIAKSKRAYLKDLIGNAVTEFIQEYEAAEGQIKETEED